VGERWGGEVWVSMGERKDSELLKARLLHIYTAFKQSPKWSEAACSPPANKRTPRGEFLGEDTGLKVTEDLTAPWACDLCGGREEGWGA